MKNILLYICPILLHSVKMNSVKIKKENTFLAKENFSAIKCVISYKCFKPLVKIK